ncbi:hypothetical protein FSP39_008560 [Pinctada imbricata]|uniref:Adenylyltransferase and sulfurtransferase MOCS3 homolog n=1 Tax=Pinctada imbricata TaxID=66713 RepID=A0AA88XUR6_PINIB|nr:hypothetical protein FSP39_008560 [Pinctada imbricata]
MSSDELSRLNDELREKEREIKRLKNLLEQNHLSQNTNQADPLNPLSQRKRLTNEEISRYSRQLILPEIGVQGKEFIYNNHICQLSISSKSVLIVGAGGLGCPSAVYLAAAGIGRLGIVDYDEVELSNLHRQVLHSEAKVGVTKSVSAAEACRSLNSKVEYVPYHLQLDSSNAIQIIQEYDIVLDASDNVATRYLLNDACVLTKKPLISGSALRFEGQLTVYNYANGPCYRCLFPKPPPPETVTNCSDGGVLGVIPGIIGSLQALEALKIAAGQESSFSGKLLMFDGMEGTFHKIKLRGRQPMCVVCGDNPSITTLIDYQQFCGARADDKEKSLNVLSPEDRISVQEYRDILNAKKRHLLVDVRTSVEMEICKLPTSVHNLPIADINKTDKINELKEAIHSVTSDSMDKLPVFVVCRRGNDSQTAVKQLRTCLDGGRVEVKDIRGGLHAWAKSIDKDFPTY